MKDESLKKTKKGASKDGDEEMTVVVPPSKQAKKLSSSPGDADGEDVAMDDGDRSENETKIDPVAQTVTGKDLCSIPRFTCLFSHYCGG